MSRCYWIGCTICLFQQLALLALSEARSATSEALPPASEAFSAASEVLSAGWLPGTPKGPLYRFGADLLKLRWVWRIDTSTHRCTEGPKDRCTDASMHRRTDGPTDRRTDAKFLQLMSNHSFQTFSGTVSTNLIHYVQLPTKNSPSNRFHRGNDGEKQSNT